MAMNYLGIDYGEAKVGLAVALGPLAEPLTTVETGQALQVIKQMLEKNPINGIIIGKASEEFLTKLKALGPKVIEVDETLSSHDARLQVAHKPKLRRKMAEHSAAAAIILQNWLDLGPAK